MIRWIIDFSPVRIKPLLIILCWIIKIFKSKNFGDFRNWKYQIDYSKWTLNNSLTIDHTIKTYNIVYSILSIIIITQWNHETTTKSETVIVPKTCPVSGDWTKVYVLPCAHTREPHTDVIIYYLSPLLYLHRLNLFWMLGFCLHVSN